MGSIFRISRTPPGLIPGSILEPFFPKMIQKRIQEPTPTEVGPREAILLENAQKRCLRHFKNVKNTLGFTVFSESRRFGGKNRGVVEKGPKKIQNLSQKWTKRHHFRSQNRVRGRGPFRTRFRSPSGPFWLRSGLRFGSFLASFSGSVFGRFSVAVWGRSGSSKMEKLTGNALGRRHGRGGSSSSWEQLIEVILSRPFGGGRI